MPVIGARQLEVLRAVSVTGMLPVEPKAENATYRACLRLQAQRLLVRVEGGFAKTAKGEHALEDHLAKAER